MTITTDVSGGTPYLSDGVTIAYTVPWKVLAANEVSVQVISPGGVVTQPAFTASNLNKPTGTITLTAPATAGYTVLILPSAPVTQPFAFRGQGPLDPGRIEDALDHVVRMVVAKKDAGFGDMLLRSDLGSAGAGKGVDLVTGATRATDLASTGAGKGGALVGFQQTGTGSKGRTQLDKSRERLSVKDFGAYGDGTPHPLSERYATLAAAQVDYPHALALTDTADWAATVAAVNSILTGEFGGGTVYFPHGAYIFNRKVQVNGIVGPATTNIWFEGDGPLASTLDFFTAPGGTDGIYFNGGAHVGLRKLMLDRVPGRGLVLNDNFTGYVSSVALEQVRVQRCGGDGIYSKNSYLVTLDDVFSNANGGEGYNFVGNHTSIIGRKVYARLNTGNGITINGAVYISINGQSDQNLRGFVLSNIRGGVLHAPGTESNKAEGFLIKSSDASATNIIGEYQNIEGLTIIGATQIRNNVNGPLGTNPNSFSVITANSRPIYLTLIGCVDNVTAGDNSIAISAAAGAVAITQVDCRFGGPTVNPNAAPIRDLSNTGKYALVTKSSGAQSVTSATPTVMAFDGFAAGENTMGATFSGGNEIVIPAGINAVRVSACVSWAGNATGSRYIAIQKNGVDFPGSPRCRIAPAGTTAMEQCMASSKPIPVVAGDLIRLLVIQDSGGALNINGATGNNCWMCVEAVR